MVCVTFMKALLIPCHCGLIFIWSLVLLGGIWSHIWLCSGPSWFSTRGSLLAELRAPLMLLGIELVQLHALTLLLSLQPLGFFVCTPESGIILELYGRALWRALLELYGRTVSVAFQITKFQVNGGLQHAYKLGQLIFSFKRRLGSCQPLN